MLQDKYGEQIENKISLALISLFKLNRRWASAAPSCFNDTLFIYHTNNFRDHLELIPYSAINGFY